MMAFSMFAFGIVGVLSVLRENQGHSSQSEGVIHDNNASLYLCYPSGEQRPKTELMYSSLKRGAFRFDFCGMNVIIDWY